jgi:hypothetical protein
VELVGINEPHAAFREESRMRQTCLELRTGNPGESRMECINANKLHRKSGLRKPGNAQYSSRAWPAEYLEEVVLWELK